MRFKFVCAMAATLPNVIVRIARTARIMAHSSTRVVSAPARIRISAANPAAFAPTDMKAVTDVGAPWYTSGVHMWNGTSATLKPKPTMARPIPSQT